MRTAAIVTLLLAVAACTGDRNMKDVGERSRTEPPTGAAMAHADMKDANGRDMGWVRFHETPGGLAVTGDLKNLSPGQHGFHVHENASCEAPAFESAGGHFNPTGKQHGPENAEDSHAGDLGNIIAAADGTSSPDVMASRLSLQGETGILAGDGTSIVVHADPDDRKSDPSGNSGARLACGVIEAGSN